MNESDKKRFNARIRGEILISADARYVGTTTTQSVAEVKIADSSLSGEKHGIKNE